MRKQQYGPFFNDFKCVMYSSKSCNWRLPSLSCVCFVEQDKRTWILPTVVFVLVPIILTPIMAYVIMFHCGRIKRWLRDTRYEIPDDVSTRTDTRRIHTACSTLMKSQGNVVIDLPHISLSLELGTEIRTLQGYNQIIVLIHVIMFVS